MYTCARASESGDAVSTTRTHHCSAHKDAQRGADNAQHATHNAHAPCGTARPTSTMQPATLTALTGRIYPQSHHMLYQIRLARRGDALFVCATHAPGCMSQLSCRAHRIESLHPLVRHSRCALHVIRCMLSDACSCMLRTRYRSGHPRPRFEKIEQPRHCASWTPCRPFSSASPSCA